MAEDRSDRLIQDNLLDHPAVKAWSQLQPARIEPERIWILKGQKGKRTRSSSAYLLDAVGADGSAVVAKQCRRTTAILERTIYESILPRLPLNGLRYYGYVQDPSERFGWLFLEDAGTDKVVPTSQEHRIAAAQWLAQVHTSTMSVAAAAELPARGQRHSLQHLHSGYGWILENLSNPALTAAG